MQNSQINSIAPHAMHESIDIYIYILMRPLRRTRRYVLAFWDIQSVFSCVIYIVFHYGMSNFKMQCWTHAASIKTVLEQRILALDALWGALIFLQNCIFFGKHSSNSKTFQISVYTEIVRSWKPKQHSRRSTLVLGVRFCLMISAVVLHRTMCIDAYS